ncbi:MAG: UvrD-helicase domain-containing protein [Elusimicrobiota bacterium]
MEKEIKNDIGISTDLNPEQLDAVKTVDGPLVILAGAGSGKTRVITYRIVYLLKLGIPPESVLAVTFTNKAAGEMRNRINTLTPGLGARVDVSTFHSWCARFLRREAQSAGLHPGFVIYDEDDQRNLIKEVVEELELDEKKFRPSPLAEEINRAKDNLLDASSYAIHSLASNDPAKKLLANIYQYYQQKLERSNAVDFGDLILKTVNTLRNDTVVFEKYRQNIQYLLVDEYQDTNHAQYVLTKLIASYHRNLCVVGDDDQAIYSWRGADVRNLWMIEQDFPEAKVVKLERNYRSTPEILELAWNVVRNNFARKEKKLWTQNPSGPVPVYINNYNDYEESENLAANIRYLLSITAGRKYSDFAVFYRTNAQSRVIEEIFVREGIPYQVVGTVSFYLRTEIKDAVAYLRVIHNPNDSLAFKRIINRPQRGIGKTSMQVIEDYMAANDLSFYQALKQTDKIQNLSPKVRTGITQVLCFLHEWIGKKKTVKPSVLLREILEKTGYLEELNLENTVQAKNRVDNLRELVSAIAELEERTNEGNSETDILDLFLNQLALMSGPDNWDPNQERVTLMTVHLAKGLEFPVVFMTGMEDGLFPLGESLLSSEELEEERRLCYVGMTRARERLYLSSASQRRVYGQMRYHMPSRFITESQILELNTKEKIGSVPEFGEYETSNSALEHTKFHVGQRVRHSEFGDGQIVGSSGQGMGLKVIVQFDNGSWKKLVVKYANLELI